MFKTYVKKLKDWAGNSKLKLALIAMLVLGAAGALNVYFPGNAVSIDLEQSMQEDLPVPEPVSPTVP